MIIEFLINAGIFVNCENEGFNLIQTDFKNQTRVKFNHNQSGKIKLSYDRAKTLLPGNLFGNFETFESNTGQPTKNDQ